MTASRTARRPIDSGKEKQVNMRWLSIFVMAKAPDYRKNVLDVINKHAGLRTPPVRRARRPRQSARQAPRFW